MKSINYFLGLILFLFILEGCTFDRDVRQNVLVKGQILDSITGKAIPNAQIIVFGWYRFGEEESYEKVDTFVNADGSFETKFSEAFKIEIGAIARGYHPSVLKIIDLDKPINVTMKLLHSRAVGKTVDLGQMAVFFRDSNKNTNVRELYGIDILNGKNTSILDSIDIGLEESKKDSNKKILITQESGGIIPIFSLANKKIAPITGYKTKYEITGKEAGFFVKCRDGMSYAKLTASGFELDRSIPSKDGSLKDSGIMFQVYLLTEGREFGIPENFRLDYFMLGNLF